MARDMAVLTLAFLLCSGSASAQDPEVAARLAEEDGRLDDALRDYVAALRALPDPPPLASEYRIRERILKIVAATGSSLPVPAEAADHLARGRSLVEAQAVLGSGGDTGGLEAAAAEFRQAVRIAPWWPEAAFGLAGVEQKLQRYESAAANLRLYRIAVPADTPPPAAAASPAAPHPAAPPGPARVFVYWPSQFGSSMNPNRLKCDGSVIAKLKEGRVVLLNLKPGAHTLDWGQTVSMDFEAGAEYFLRAKYEGSIVVSKRLRLAPRAEALAEMAKKKVKPVDGDDLFEVECGAAVVPDHMP